MLVEHFHVGVMLLLTIDVAEMMMKTTMMSHTVTNDLATTAYSLTCSMVFLMMMTCSLTLVMVGSGSFCLMMMA